MEFAFAVAAVLAQMASPPTPQTISLHPGQTVTLRVKNGSAVVEHSGAAAPLTHYEIYALWRAETEQVPSGVKVVPPGFLHGGEGPPHPPHPSGDRLEITMQQVPGLKPGSRPNTVLFLRNGYASKLRYTAVMSGAGRSASTDVCDVAPHLLGLEYWPYPIKELDLSSFQLVEWDNAIECK